MHYYDLLIGNDLCVYPSYYEPWGYTPTESVAFHVPCITTDLAGFGLWVNTLKGGYSDLVDGVKVIHRTDGNFVEAAESLKAAILNFSKADSTQVAQMRKNAGKIAEKALWEHFIKNYYNAYNIALNNRNKRLKL
jgi:glycosyltransferase involved in cell wall biosynthesis